MTNDGKYWIVYNGEIYNHIKLREQVNISHGDNYLEVEKESRKWMTGRFSK